MLFRSGQEKLKHSKVAVVGAGGLGGPVIQYLAAAGVGTITIIDFDNIEISNLNRQVLYGVQDCGKSKAKVAAEKISLQYNDVIVKICTDKITEKNVQDILKNHTCVISCVDSFQTRITILKNAFSQDIPVIDGGVARTSGYVLPMKKEKACLACLYGGEVPQFSNESPQVFGAMAGVVGSMQAVLCIKALLQPQQVEYGIDNMIDLTNFNIEKVKISKDKTCHICCDK